MHDKYDIWENIPNYVIMRSVFARVITMNTGRGKYGHPCGGRTNETITQLSERL